MVEIVAEIGVNHDGSMDKALQLMEAAQDAGCNTVKYQLFSAERSYAPERCEEMKRLELSRDNIKELKRAAELMKIGFLCTPDDLDDARFLRDIGVERIKIGSSNVTNLPLLRAVAAFDVDVILSTGACSQFEVAKAVQQFGRINCGELILLHCVSAYPAPLSQMNMRAINMLAAYGYPVGLSDHTLGTDAAVMALAMGACIIEKHLTLDRNADGPDHWASIEPDEMKRFVETLRHCEIALGDGPKRVMPCEEENRKAYEAFVARQMECA